MSHSHNTSSPGFSSFFEMGARTLLLYHPILPATLEVQQPRSWKSHAESKPIGDTSMVKLRREC
jgi:hypothetical protein